MEQFLSQIHDTATIFLGIVIEALPFLLIGVTISALIGIYVSEKWLVKHVPRNPIFGSFLACFLGIFMPVCECGNIPVARKLLSKKVPLSIVISFLLAAPVMNPIVLWATFSAFRDMPEVVGLRFLFTLIIAWGIGLLFALSPKGYVSPQILEEPNPHNATTKHINSHVHSKRRFQSLLLKELFEMMTVLIPGALIAAITQTFIPRDWLVTIGKDPLLSILTMLTLAFILSVCANVDAFIALSYRNTFTTSSLVAFLVFGPMIDLKSIIMLRKVFSWKVVAYIAVLAALMTVLLTLGYHYYFR